MSGRRDVWSKDARAPCAARPGSLWSQIQTIASRGRHPVVTLPRALEIVEPARPRGRPRLYAVGARRGRDTGYSLVTPNGSPMRCRNRGCQRTLKKEATSICCSKTCEEQLRNECLDILDVLDERVEARHLAPRHRDRHGAWFRRLESGR